MLKDHQYYMKIALEEAKSAGAKGEIPVGAVVVAGGEIIARGGNSVESNKNPLAHAEINALKRAGEVSGRKWLQGATLYSTLEPCPLCASAAVFFRIERIVYGAQDTNWGACGTVFNIPAEPRFNHRIEVIGGIMEEQCAEILKDFFRRRRL
jgi:tRNA(adenine34) deaminase